MVYSPFGDGPSYSINSHIAKEIKKKSLYLFQKQHLALISNSCLQFKSWCRTAITSWNQNIAFSVNKPFLSHYSVTSYCHKSGLSLWIECSKSQKLTRNINSCLSCSSIQLHLQSLLLLHTQRFIAIKGNASSLIQTQPVWHLHNVTFYCSRQHSPPAHMAVETPATPCQTVFFINLM